MCGCALAHAFSRMYYGGRALGFAGFQVVARLVLFALVVSWVRQLCALVTGGWVLRQEVMRFHCQRIN
jgi:hypothetical protein